MPCNLYGPNDEFDKKKSPFFACFNKKISSIKKTNKVEIWGSGNAKRN